MTYVNMNLFCVKISCEYSFQQWTYTRDTRRKYVLKSHGSINFSNQPQPNLTFITQLTKCPYDLCQHELIKHTQVWKTVATHPTQGENMCSNLMRVFISAINLNPILHLLHIHQLPIWLMSTWFIKHTQFEQSFPHIGHLPLNIFPSSLLLL